MPIAYLHIILATLCCCSTLLAQQNRVVPHYDNELPSVQYNIENYDTAALLKDLKAIAPLSTSMPDSALAVYYTIFEKTHTINFNRGGAIAMNGIGLIYFNKGMFAQAEQAIMRSLYYAERTDGIRGKGLACQAYSNLGAVYQYLGEHKKAAACLFRAAFIATEYPEAYNRIQLIYCNLGILEINSRLALYYLNKADSLSRIRKDTSVLISTLQNRADIYKENKQWKQSEAILNELEALGQLTNDPLTQYRVLIAQANLQYTMANPATALQLLNEAKKILPEGDPDTYHNIVNETLLGNVYYHIDDFNNAEIHLLNALDKSKNINARKELLTACLSLANMYNERKQYEKANTYLQRYIQLKDSIMNEQTANNISTLEVRFRTAEKDNDIIRSQLALANQQRSLLRKNIWIGSITIGSLIIIFTLVIFIISNRRRQRVLSQQREIEQLKAIMKGEEKERSRLARELHDGIGGMLAAIKMNIGSAIKLYPDAAHQMKLSAIDHMLHDTSKEIRKTAHNLMPDVLIKHDLEQALTVYCSRINEGRNLQIDLQFHGSLAQLDKATELILYRMVQELIQNVIKHSEATHADIQVIRHENSLHISVEDNGHGFNLEETTNGFGLENLRFRVQALHGNVSIISAKGKSTTVHIEFDVTKLEQATNK